MRQRLLVVEEGKVEARKRQTELLLTVNWPKSIFNGARCRNKNKILSTGRKIWNSIEATEKKSKSTLIIAREFEHWITVFWVEPFNGEKYYSVAVLIGEMDSYRVSTRTVSRNIANLTQATFVGSTIGGLENSGGTSKISCISRVRKLCSVPGWIVRPIS